MSFTRWLRTLGRSTRPVARTSRYLPNLESLDDRLAPSAGLGWGNFLSVPIHWGSPASSPPKVDAGDNSAVATELSVFVTRDATVDGQVQVVVVARGEDGEPVKSYTGTVHFTSTDGAATLPDDYTFTAADRGRHVFTAVFGT